MSGLRVAILVGRLGAGTGTAGVAARLCRGLLARGHEVRVHTDRVDAPVPGVDVAEMGDRWRAAARVPPGFVRIALDRVPGCHVVRASGGVHRAWLRARGGLPSPGDVGEAALDHLAARTAGVVICNSWRTAGEVAAHHGVPHARIAVVRTGVDLAAFVPDPAARDALRARIGAEGRVALFAGHGFRRKGLDVAVAAFAAAAGPRDKLVVAGRDARAQRRLGQARAVLGDRLVSVGAVSVAAWLAAADALVLPSLYDSASNTVLEALAAGVPPVVSARDGSSEIVPDRRWVVGDPRSVAGFADALSYAWDVGGADRCRAAAARWPEARMVDEVEGLLRRVEREGEHPVERAWPRRAS